MSGSFPTAEIARAIERGILALGMEASSALVGRMSRYLALLHRWNRAYNLTAVREPAGMVARHLLDSLSIAPHVDRYPGEVLDIGSGAGLPGVPLALWFPHRKFCLLDGNGKKTRFLFQVKTELGLANIVVCQARVEAFGARRRYGLIVSRAFSGLARMVELSGHLLAAEGHFLAMKGALPEREINALASGVDVAGVHLLRVPGLRKARHLVDLAIADQGLERAGRTTGTADIGQFA